MNCALCGSTTTAFAVVQKRAYHQCSTCNGISLHPSHFLSDNLEKKRYETHNNDVTDPGYRRFVSPIVDAILTDYDPIDKGLDFGSGTTPIITVMLRNLNYDIDSYDPFFDPNPKALQTTYSYIACCEVMEHFYNPNQEFTLLYSLLQEKGSLYCKTKLYNTSINFDSWWYKNDATHVFFYTKETLYWIKEHYNFNEIQIFKELIIFKK